MNLLNEFDKILFYFDKFVIIAPPRNKCRFLNFSIEYTIAIIAFQTK